MHKRVALYVRVSTSEQTTKNQKRELIAASKRQSWQIVKIFEDAGISGAKDRSGRPGLDALLKSVTRKEIDLVAAWSVDRIGRSLQDLVHFLSDLHSKGVDLYLHQQGLDTTTPSGKAMFQMLGVFAEFERAIIRERISVGLRRARAEGKHFGRPRVSAETEVTIRKLRKSGLGMRKIATSLNIGTSVVQRVLA